MIQIQINLKETTAPTVNVSAITLHSDATECEENVAEQLFPFLQVAMNEALAKPEDKGGEIVTLRRDLIVPPGYKG